MPTIPKPHMTTLIYAVIIIVVFLVLYHLFVKKG